MLCLMCPFCIVHIDECERTITLLFNAKLRERSWILWGDKKRIQRHRGGAILYSGGSLTSKKKNNNNIYKSFFLVSLIF